MLAVDDQVAGLQLEVHSLGVGGMPLLQDFQDQRGELVRRRWDRSTSDTLPPSGQACVLALELCLAVLQVLQRNVSAGHLQELLS